MLKKICLFFVFNIFVCISLFAQDSDWYKDKKIKKIDFEGLSTISPTTMSVIFDKYKGQVLSDKNYLEILQRIYELEYFKTDIVTKVLPTDETYSEVKLVFDVKELPFVEGYRFIGNKNVSGSEMLKVILLKKGDIFNEAKANIDKQNVAKFLKTKGFASSSLSTEYIVNEEKNSVSIRYNITEGKQTVVNKISFEGVTIFTERKLKKSLATKEKSLFNQGAYQQANIQQDKLNIYTLYGEKGYANANVETVKEAIDESSDPERNLVSLTYVIFEGEQYLYGSTKFIGNKIFSNEELQSKIKLKDGDVLNMTKINKGFSDVAELYYENGYMMANINPSQQVDGVSKKTSFEVVIHEGERSHIENIIIRGNTKTHENVIRRELLFEEGDVFSKSKVENSLRNLFNLQYFSQVLPETQAGSEINLVDLIINVEEQQTANIGFGISFSGSSDPNAFPLSAFVNWSEKNFIGRGSMFDASLNAGSDEQSLKLGYTENWFCGTPLSVGFNVSATHKKMSAYQDIRPPFGIPDPLMSMSSIGDLANAYSMKYDRWELGFGVNTGYAWFPRFAVIRLGGGLNFRLVKNFYDNNHFRPFDPITRKEAKRWSFNNSLYTDLALDSRDMIYDPSKGWLLSQQVAFFGIVPKLENEYFLRSTTKGEIYFTLLNYPVSDYWSLKFVLAFYSGLTMQHPLQKEPISLDSKLYIDGMFTGRGWSNLGYAGSGDVLLDHWVEFRMPLAPGILAFDFFFEAAAVKDTIKDLAKLKIDDYYFSFGPGLRFLLPQLPLRLMFANTFRSKNWKPYWGNGKGADWRFVLSFNVPNR